MSRESGNSDSILYGETSLRWAFLADEPDACAVVSDRMELVYLNARARELVRGNWFAKRCFEVLPNVDAACAFHCPTMRAVNDAGEVRYCEEILDGKGGEAERLGVAVIPVPPDGESAARAVLLLRAQKDSPGEAFRERLLSDARILGERIVRVLR